MRDGAADSQADEQAVGTGEREYRLAAITRPEALKRAAAGAIGLLPVGSLEQHGDHLPLGTDYLLAETVCLQAAPRSNVDVLVAPSIWAGFSPHHLRFGAVTSLRAETFLGVVRECVAQLTNWLSFVVVVNGHGGNRGLLASLGFEPGVEGVSSAICYWDLAANEGRRLFPEDSGGLGHAGQAETSMMLSAFGDLVGTPAPEFVPCIPDQNLMFPPDLGQAGVMGNPHVASREAGTAFLAVVADRLATFLDDIPERLSQSAAPPRPRITKGDS